MTWNFEEIFFPLKFYLGGDICRQLCGRMRRTGEFSWPLLGTVWCQSLCGPDWHTTYLIMPVVLLEAVFVLPLEDCFWMSLVTEREIAYKTTVRIKTTAWGGGGLGSSADVQRPLNSVIAQQTSLRQDVPAASWFICHPLSALARITLHGTFQRAKAQSEVIFPKARHLKSQHVYIRIYGPKS